MSTAAARERPDNRRYSETFSFDVNRDGVPPIAYTATVSFFPDGRVADLFIRGGKAGSDVSISTNETALAVSMALQHGTPLETIRKAMPRTNDGRPEGAIGTLLDLLVREGVVT